MTYNCPTYPQIDRAILDGITYPHISSSARALADRRDGAQANEADADEDDYNGPQDDATAALATADTAGNWWD